MEAGQEAPGFTLPDQDGRPVSLRDFRGRKVLVYFYPRDESPGCTAEACQFNAALSDFAGLGVDVLGISADDISSHRSFREHHGLNFSLLSDRDHAVAERYGAWGHNTRPDGVEYVGVIRSTFLIDEGGGIEHAWHRVKVDGHALAVLTGLRAG